MRVRFPRATSGLQASHISQPENSQAIQTLEPKSNLTFRNPATRVSTLYVPLYADFVLPPSLLLMDRLLSSSPEVYERITL